MTSNDARELSGATLLVGVCGGIAAYKCAGIVSTLRQAGADVHVIMTDAATKFVTPLTFQAISNNDVHTDMFAQGSTWDIAHIGLVRKSDIMLVLNATANTIAKLAHGIADDLLTTCVLATRKPVIIAPAMNTAMLEAAPTQENIAALQGRGFDFVEPGSGFLACGEVGSGRLAGDDDIIAAVRRVLHRTHQLSGERVLITAGPTREFADPARFLTNPSTGRMGFALASEAAARGARVTLITGPTELHNPANVDVIRVTSAREMHAAVFEHLPGTTLFIGSAAVADFRPETVVAQKVKKEDAWPEIRLARNPDIIAEVSERRPNGCIVIGFAAESERVEANALDKLQRKKLDAIVANPIGGEGSAYGGDDSEATLLWPGGRRALGRGPKTDVAAAVLDLASTLRGNSG
ncbi:MAG TPA: bifunctional phosphopantothenoylcysteine decarboxylase/phosphopantothenate--cysteine ligase CoaBC [Candidatus Binatus sp.]|nr:bifunctional phosphopantothenoylcysteine decarboxylase/phosphopantothenate--cysteine ligase CoaBC [Candidatus Binatus sp.]